MLKLVITSSTVNLPRVFVLFLDDMLMIPSCSQWPCSRLNSWYAEWLLLVISWLSWPMMRTAWPKRSVLLTWPSLPDLQIFEYRWSVNLCVGQGSRSTAVRPYLRVIDPNMDFYDEISNDALSIRGFQGYRCNDYHLGEWDLSHRPISSGFSWAGLLHWTFCLAECLIEEHMYFIVSPKDIVLARQRDKDDHIQWLLEHAKYEVSARLINNDICLI